VKTSSTSGIRRHAAQMHALAAVRREIRSRDSASRTKYLREFTEAFRKYDAALTPEQLSTQVAAADTILVGDYHALASSQRSAATLIERLAAERPVVLGVEAVLARDQPILDAWWRREIGEVELRRRLRFDREWGYEWPAFYELLVVAREHGEGVYGLDCMPRHDMRRIRSRDHHAATKIVQMRAQHPNAALLVLFGESHMAPTHLPAIVKQLSPCERILTILQNIDALYWQATGEAAQAVSLNTDTVCVFNSTPLEKYESYRLCLEKWNGDDQPDFAPAVYNVIFSMARSLGFRLDSPHNGTQPKYLADSLPEVVHADDDGFRARLSDTDGKSVEEHGCAYLREMNTFVVREFEMVSAAAAGARFLLHACRGFRQEQPPRALEDALAHFGARLMCPGNLDANLMNPEGEGLYHAYLEGRISRAAVRKLFLTGCEEYLLRQFAGPATASVGTHTS
jgi:Haem-binding uptake, Tiki superfamily, ChaN